MRDARLALALITLASAMGCSPATGTYAVRPSVMSSAQQMAVADAPIPPTILYSFASTPNGLPDPSGLTFVNGVFYGTTFNGGANDKGTVFSLDSGGNETTLYSFGSGTDGTFPSGGLLDVDGVLYGTTQKGGAYNYGTVFSITPSGTYTLLYSFGGSSSDGQIPVAGLTALNGVLYGTTLTGGTTTYGTVFSVTRRGVETVMHTFNGYNDGLLPEGGLVALDGILYGTTRGSRIGAGEGVVYSITPGGTETILHSFGSGTDGALPYSSLVALHGVLYGTTTLGGLNNKGTAFSITTTGTETVLHSFGATPADGVTPYTNLTVFHGELYGACGGGENGLGTIYRVTTNGYEQVLYHFRKSPAANDPNAPLLNLNGVLYSTTLGGGTNNQGTVFSFTPP